MSDRHLSLGGRQGRVDPALSRHRSEDEGHGLLSSRAFWIGGLLSILAWIAAGAAVVAIVFGGAA